MDQTFLQQQLVSLTLSILITALIYRCRNELLYATFVALLWANNVALKFWDRVWCFMPSWLGKIEPLNDPMNGTDVEHNIGYVSRWSVVEFGVGCTRCGEVAAPRMGFHLIRRVRLPDRSIAEVIDCPHCHTVLVASPVTEKGEHLIPDTSSTRRELATFARKRHVLSPLSPMEAHTERKRLKIRDLVAVNPLDHVRYAQEQANAEKPLGFSVNPSVTSATGTTEPPYDPSAHNGVMTSTSNTSN